MVRLPRALLHTSLYRFTNPELGSKTGLTLKMTTPVTSVPSSPKKAKPQFYRRILPETCISFSSKEGKDLFIEALQAGYMEGYFGLAAQFRTQDEPAFCGLSTLVMVLNTLEVDPERVWKGPWRWYHENMLDCCVPLDIAAKNGITFDEMACLASCNTLCVSMVRVDSSVKEETFREVVKHSTKRDDEVLVASYSRSVLGQTGDGHFSPIAGYHEECDLVLILDTARFKYPPHWVPLTLLHKSMQACDKDTGQPRGFMQLRRSDNVPLVLFRVGESLSLSSIENKEVEKLENGTPASSLDAFLDSWTTWLNGTSKEASHIDLLISATEIMVDSLSKLDENDSILTTQVDVSCPENLSATHGCVIKELLANLESLPLYGIVEKQLKQSKPVPYLIAEVAEFEQKPYQCRRLKQNLCPKTNSLDSEKRGDDDAVEEYFPTLMPTHLVTMLICAWPAFRCSVTNCNNLRKAVQAQLFKTSTVLQDEVAQLSKQLNSVLSFKKNCGRCGSKPGN